MRLHRKPIRISDSQAHLPFRSKNAGLLSHATPLERRFLGVLSGAFLLVSLLYVYFLASSVGYVSAREEMAQQARTLSGETAFLEARYLARAVDMTESYAGAQGLVRAKGQAFVERETNLTLER